MFPKEKRNTCECIYHSNVELLINSLNKAEIVNIKSNHDILTTICCDRYNENCLDRKCTSCKNKVVEYLEFNNDVQILYYEWRKIIETQEKDGKEIRKLLWTKTANYETPTQVIRKFDKAIEFFCLIVPI